MNRLGILIDVSHAAESSVRDVLAASDRPVIASHSGCRALNDHPRNLSDATLRELARAGGVLGVVFCTLSSAAMRAGKRRGSGSARRTKPYPAATRPNWNCARRNTCSAKLRPLPWKPSCATSCTRWA
ncbi:MAG: membrane dipeptidase [Planctomycetota bacterium]